MNLKQFRQRHVFDLLKAKGPLPIGDIAEAFCTKKQSVVHVLFRLRVKGCVRHVGGRKYGHWEAIAGANEPSWAIREESLLNLELGRVQQDRPGIITPPTPMATTALEAAWGWLPKCTLSAVEDAA